MWLMLWLAQNAPVDDKIDSPLEYWFGALALAGIVVTWTWLWLRIRGKVKNAESELKQPEAKA